MLLLTPFLCLIAFAAQQSLFKDNSSAEEQPFPLVKDGQQPPVKASSNGKKRHPPQPNDCPGAHAPSNPIPINLPQENTICLLEGVVDAPLVSADCQYLLAWTEGEEGCQANKQQWVALYELPQPTLQSILSLPLPGSKQSNPPALNQPVPPQTLYWSVTEGRIKDAALSVHAENVAVRICPYEEPAKAVVSHDRRNKPKCTTFLVWNTQNGYQESPIVITLDQDTLGCGEILRWAVSVELLAVSTSDGKLLVTRLPSSLAAVKVAIEFVTVTDALADSQFALGGSGTIVFAECQSNAYQKSSVGGRCDKTKVITFGQFDLNNNVFQPFSTEPFFGDRLNSLHLDLEPQSGDYFTFAASTRYNLTQWQAYSATVIGSDDPALAAGLVGASRDALYFTAGPWLTEFDVNSDPNLIFARLASNLDYANSNSYWYFTDRCDWDIVSSWYGNLNQGTMDQSSTTLLFGKFVRSSCLNGSRLLQVKTAAVQIIPPNLAGTPKKDDLSLINNKKDAQSQVAKAGANDRKIPARLFSLKQH